MHARPWAFMFGFILRCSESLIHVVSQPLSCFALSVFDHTFSANILLDDQFQPKLTDFAAAHFRPHLEQQSSTINMTGSGRKHLWYMPEEYIRQGRLTVKTDVYSFGIVSVPTDEPRMRIQCCEGSNPNSSPLNLSQRSPKTMLDIYITIQDSSKIGVTK